MKKLISQILIIVMILGTVGIVPSYAIAQDYLAEDFLLNEGYWKEGNFNPTAYATRAQVASVFANYLSDLNPAYTNIYTDVSESHKYADDIMLATNLGLVSGAGGKFRPDEAISREEFAIILVKAHEIAGEKLLDSNYPTEIMKDYDSISSWAKTSVVDALGNGLIVSQDKKLFNPKGAVTLSELAISLYNLHFVDDAAKTTYTVRDVTASDNVSTKFDVLKSFSAWNTVGVSGAGVIAHFDGAPGEIYIKRNKSSVFINDESRAALRNNFGEPVCYARIIGPDGNVICYVDMDYLESGSMEKIVNIPEGPKGIYQIQFTQSIAYEWIKDQDVFTVGLKNPSSWGVRGEDEIVFVDDTLPTTGYIYIPEKFNHLSIGIGGKNSTLKLYDASNKLLGEVTEGSYSYDGLYSPVKMNFTTEITPGTVLKYELTEGYRGRLGITGVTPVIYSSKEDALELKSGYIYHKDKYTGDDFLQLAGPLQQKARERMVEIYEEAGGADGLAVNITDKIPTTIPSNLDNPLAEAQPFSVYSSSIYNLKSSIDTQCLDPSNPYFGALIEVASQSSGFTGIKDSDYEGRDWQVGIYTEKDDVSFMHNHGFTGLSLNSELNPYYNNEQLIKRAELFALYVITQLPADCMIKTENTVGRAVSDDLRNHEAFFMADGTGGYAASYCYTRGFFSPKTRSITDQGVLMIMDKLMNFKGKTPANQNMMAYLATAYTYKWSGEDRYHKNLKNQLMGFMSPALKESGQSPLGYWIESFGADGGAGGGYGKMSEEVWNNIIYVYLSLPESMKDPELVAKIYEAEELYLKWDSYFIMPSNDTFLAVRPTNWTSRTNTSLGGHNMRGENGLVINYFPRAKKNWLAITLGNNWKDYKTFDVGDNNVRAGEGFSAISNAFIITNDTWAKSYIDERLADENFIFNQYYNSKDPNERMAQHSEMYYVHHQEQQFDDSEMPILPYETEGDYKFFLDKNGIVTVKHKGMYMICYFNNALYDTRDLSQHSWIGGGPTSLWDEYFTTTLNGLKPGSFTSGKDVEKNSTFIGRANAMKNGTSTAEYDLATYGYTVDDFRHSCIIGTDENGRMFVSGREKPEFSWIVSNKSFRIKGTQTTTNGSVSRSKEIVWEYYLTDTGIQIKGGVTTYKNGQNLYMQLPIYVPKGASSVIDTDNTKIVISHNNNTITYDWGNEEAVTRELTCSTGKYIYLKLPITSSNRIPAVTISRSIAS